MGLTFAYMPLRPYTRLAERKYGLQICRACGDRRSRSNVLPKRKHGLGNPAPVGNAGIPATLQDAMWVACMQRCVGAVCRQPCFTMPSAPQPRKIFSDLTRGRRLGTMQDAFTRCRSSSTTQAITRVHSDGGWMSRPPMVMRPSCGTARADARCNGLSAVGWTRPCHDSHVEEHRTEEE